MPLRKDQRADLNDILVFLTIVKTGSFVGGSETAGLIRSATGQAVPRLEERLGVRLRNRTTRRRDQDEYATAFCFLLKDLLPLRL